MPQHDLVLDNGSGAAFRADANNALAALGSTMKGPNAPPAPIAGMMWLDDDTPSASVWTLKLYDGADWISIATFDISANTWAPVITRLALGAGSAAAPAYSFSGDTDTGIYNSGANSLDFSANGERIFNVSGSPGFSAALIENAAGSFYSTLYLRSKDSSASVARATYLGAVNELFTGVATVEYKINTDGSGNIELYATPAGSRASDRRVLRATIPGSGAISLTGDVDVTGNLRFNSGYGSAALAYGVRAWVNFNGTGTVAIRASGNVSSITDNGTGDYTVNFTTPMPDANYSYNVAASNGGEPLRVGFNATGGSTVEVAPTTSAFRFYVNNAANSAQVDPKYVNVSVIR